MSATDVQRLLTGLPPLVEERSRVLVLGSFPSAMSLAKREYYGNPQNHFWPVMGALFGFEARSPYRERTASLLANGIAVWDVIAECSREGSGDDAIMEATANRVERLLKDFPGIRLVAFNGGTAFGTARTHLPELFELDIRCERMPSTSPRHARMRLPDKIEAWSQLKLWLKEQP